MKIDGRAAYNRLKQNYKAELERLNTWKILPFMEDMLDNVVQRHLDNPTSLEMTFEIRWFDLTQMVDRINTSGENISNGNTFSIDVMRYRHILVELICKLLVLNEYEVIQHMDHDVFKKVGSDTIILIFRTKPQHCGHIVDFPEDLLQG